jgi:DNA modification methylase
VAGTTEAQDNGKLFKQACGICGAHRIDLQLGLERSLGEHVETMVDVFRAVRRVLRKDGTLWLNYGDSYATSVNGRSAADTKAVGNDDRTFRDKPFSTIGPIFRPGNSDKNGGRSNRDGLRIHAGSMLKPKDLCGIPWRVAFALQEDGWWLRQDIIWSKPNPMPESVTDRCTKAHEYIFLLTKRERYYYDVDAIKEQAQNRDPGNIHHKGCEAARNGDRFHRTKAGLLDYGPVEFRNRRSVWEIATAPFSDAHFATFPPALIEPCILAGCPKGGVVLDPFGGAGTTGLVADRLGRNAILIELNPEYTAMAERRIKDDAGMFNAIDDISRSVAEGFRAIRERKANGGAGWKDHDQLPGQMELPW